MSHPYLDKGPGGVIYAFWSEGRRSKRKSMGSKDPAVAEARFAQWLTLGGHRGSMIEDAAQILTVGECWKVYAVGENATRDYSWKNLEPHFGTMRVTDVSQKTIDSYVLKRTTGRLGRRVKPVTCRRELTLLTACLNHCARQQMFPVSAINPVTLPEAGEPRDRWLTHSEIKRLLDAAARMRQGEKLSRCERFLWIALETAARKQAILDLTWDRVDFETRMVHFDVPGRKRTKKRRPSVPISKALLPVLERAYKERENNLVMTNQGEPWTLVQYAVIEAGLGGVRPKNTRLEKPKATGVSPHVLRHTAATHMARRGVPIFMIAKVLGNSVAMVERVYAKHSSEDLRAVVDMISGKEKDLVG